VTPERFGPFAGAVFPAGAGALTTRAFPNPSRGSLNILLLLRLSAHTFPGAQKSESEATSFAKMELASQMLIFQTIRGTKKLQVCRSPAPCGTLFSQGQRPEKFAVKVKGEAK